MSREKRLIATLDFETDPFEYGNAPHPFAAGLSIEDGTYIEFWGDNVVNEICEELKGRKLRVYAHNGGKFDYMFMLEHLEPALSLINGRIAKARIGESILVDSYLILPIPLGGMDKLEIDYMIMTREVRDKPCNKSEIRKYLRADCEYLLDWVLKFNSRFGVKLTVAAAAFGELENTGYPCKAPSYESYDGVFREYYYGGRTQAFKTGVFEGEYKVYDINSAYPAAMMDAHPFGTHYVVEKSASVKELMGMEGAYFATVEGVSSGCLPYRVPGESLQYPTDDVVRTYKTTGWEIRAGLETGTLKITKVVEVLFHKEFRDFSDYVDKFFAEKSEGKREGDRSKTLFAKLMLNSAYGKFGSDGRKYRKNALVPSGCIPELTDDEERDRKALGMTGEEMIEGLGWVIDAHTEFGSSLWSRPDPAEKFYNVAVAASITGWVRAFLWRAVCNSKDVLYTDTDSIICLAFEGKLDPIKLGEWDLEGTTRGKVWIGGRKLYCMELNEKDKEGNWKVKKAHKGARLTFQEIVDIVEHGKEITWKNDAPSFSLTAGTRFVKRRIKSA